MFCANVLYLNVGQLVSYIDNICDINFLILIDNHCFIW